MCSGHSRNAIAAVATPTDWGETPNFDGAGSGPVREYFLANAGYWINEFHADGLRIDATQNIYDASDEHSLVAIARIECEPPPRGARRC